MNYGDSVEEQPLLRYSTDCERASFLDDDSDDSDNSMPRKKRAGGKRRGRKRTRKVKRRRSVKGAKGVRLVKGKVSIKLAGLGVRKLGASQLVKYISLAKLKTAAKKFLSSQGQRVPAKKRRKGKRSRQ